MVAVAIILVVVAMWLAAIIVDRAIDRTMAERYALHLAYFHGEDDA